jgi:hypothetical protein
LISRLIAQEFWPEQNFGNTGEVSREPVFPGVKLHALPVVYLKRIGALGFIKLQQGAGL